MRSRLPGFFYLFCLVLFSAMPLLAAEDWLPVPKEDLAMTSFDPFPGTHAVVLYHKEERSDKEGYERHYYRIKILDDEGKKYGNIETQLYPNIMKIGNLEARCIHADGSIVPWNGSATDKLVAKYKGLALKQKTFAIPDVQVGSVIEYRYTLRWDPGLLYDSTWYLQEYLPIRDADYILHYYVEGLYRLTWNTYFFQKVSQAPKDEKATVTMSIHNVPALEKEELMPPESEMRSRVEFVYYEQGSMRDMDSYWKDRSRWWSTGAEEFMGKSKTARAQAAALTSGNDSQEIKLRKLYDYVQKLRNLTFEREKDEKEEQREKLKAANNVEDVLKHGYGYHNELVKTFVAMARDAGFDATLIRVTERDQHFHHPQVPVFSQYDTELAVVKVDGKQLFLDPAVPYCPFGLLSWEDTGTYGLMLNKDAVVWQMTPEPDPADALEKRTASLELSREGDASGEVSLTWKGREALYERLHERDSDEAKRQKDLQDMFKGWLPNGASVELGKVDDWNATSDQFVVTAKVKIPSFGAATGKRLLLPVEIFSGENSQTYTSAKRVNPLYLRNPYKELDEVTVKVPDGMQVETVPQPHTLNAAFADMSQTVEHDNNSYKLNRQVLLKGYFFTAAQYPYVRTFMENTKSAGEEQVVLRAVAK